MSHSIKLSIILSFLILIITGTLKAQSYFLPGYILTNMGDTIYGEIDNRRDVFMSSTCKFKTSDKDSVITYSPVDIKGYKFIDNKYYVTREYNGKKWFFEYLIHAKINVYFMRNTKGGHFYVEKDSIPLTKLPYKEEIKMVNGKQVYHESADHIRLLNYFMHDAPDFQSKIESMVKPDHKPLINLAEDYHNTICKDQPCIIYQKNVPWYKLGVELISGIKGGSFGGNIYFWAPGINDRISIKTGLTYVGFYKIPFQLQYIYPAYRIQPKISVGVNNYTRNLKDFFIEGHTFAVNTGFNYAIFNSINLSLNINTDYTALIDVITNENIKFNII